jgi:pilus assembly protein CpaF
MPEWKLLDDEDERHPSTSAVAAPAWATAAVAQDGYYDEAMALLRVAALGGAGGQSGQFTAAEVEAQAPETVEWCRQQAMRILRQLSDQSLSARSVRAFDRPDEQVADEMINDMFGLGPLQPLLKDPEIEDIALAGPSDCWVKRRAGWEKTDVTFRSSGALREMLNHHISYTGRSVNPRTPIVDAALKSGARLSVVDEGIADPWPAAVIRIHHPNAISPKDLVSRGGRRDQRVRSKTRTERPAFTDFVALDNGEGPLSGTALNFLEMSVLSQLNIMVVGPTGTGKTSIINVLGSFIPADRRVIIIEDTPEIHLPRANTQRFVTRPQTLEGLPEIDQAYLVRLALRQRPDHIILGEARGGEVFHLLKAHWTGHSGGLTSIHADSVEDVFERVRMMLQEASFQTEISEQAVGLWVAKAINLIITLKKTDGRYCEEIAAFTGGVEGSTPVRQSLFIDDPEQERLVCTGQFLDNRLNAKLQAFGFDYRDVVAQARARGEVRR